MRTLVSLLTVMFFATQSMGDTFKVLKSLSGYVNSTDANHTLIKITIPEGTTGVIETHQKLPSGLFAYHLKIKHVGNGAATELKPGSEFWYPYEPNLSEQYMQFKNDKGQVTNKPKNGDSALALKTSTLTNTAEARETAGTVSSTDASCSSTLDPSNETMIKSGIDCLKKDQGDLIAKESAENASQDIVKDNSFDAAFNEMFHYLNSVKPHQAETNRLIAHYTLKYGRELGIPVILLLAMEKAETSFRPGVCSPAKACGLLQLMPDTAEKWGGKKAMSKASRSDIALNAKWATLEIRQMLDMKVACVPTRDSKGRRQCRELIGSAANHPKENETVVIDHMEIKDMLIAYNHGPHGFAKVVGGQTIPFETRNYIDAVSKNIADYYQSFAASQQPLGNVRIN